MNLKHENMNYKFKVQVRVKYFDLIDFSTSFLGLTKVQSITDMKVL